MSDITIPRPGIGAQPTPGIQFRGGKTELDGCQECQASEEQAGLQAAGGVKPPVDSGPNVDQIEAARKVEPPSQAAEMFKANWSN